MMNIKLFIGFLVVCCLSCTSHREEKSDMENRESNSAMVFDKAKWQAKDGEDYPYRNRMLNDVLYNDTVRTLSRDEILDLLGEPDRVNAYHLYYQISQKRIASWPLHTKSMVIKLGEDHTIEWIKIHE